LKQPARRQFDKIDFDPTEQNSSETYNLWRGFAVVPRNGDWSLLRSHIRDVVCGGKKSLFDYVVGWLATGVQHPAMRPEVALVFRGGQGSGKGFVAREFGFLFGEHFFHASSPRHLTGTFNAHLETAVIVFADEAFGTNDSEATANLKRLISEPTLAIEHKHRDAVTARNYAHVIVSTNSDWAIPAGPDERRFCVLDVRNIYQGNHRYFKAIEAQQRQGGREAMLYDLLHYDLSHFNVRRAPVTDALLEQKVHSFSPSQRWWFEKLAAGRLLEGRIGWPRAVARRDLQKDFATAVRRDGVDKNDRGSATALGRLLTKVLGAAKSSARLEDGRTYEFPSLQECRKLFDCWLRQPYPWPVLQRQVGRGATRLAGKRSAYSRTNPTSPTSPTLKRKRRNGRDIPLVRKKSVGKVVEVGKREVADRRGSRGLSPADLMRNARLQGHRLSEMSTVLSRRRDRRAMGVK
jgi:hypothetical protein